MAVAFVTLSACRKDRTCSCSQNGTDLGNFTYTNVKRSEAKSFCSAQQSQYQASYPGTTCALR
jgi:hypothetical protein